MDTISRENNSMLPMAGIILGGLGLLAGIFGLVTVSKVKTQVTEQQAKVDKIDEVASQASQASAVANQTKTNLDSVIKQTQDTFNDVAARLGTIQGKLVTMEEGQKRPAGKGAKGAAGAGAAVSNEPVVAGPGEYIVKSGDGGSKIAKANHVSLHDLMEVNPGVDWKKLKPGQKLKLPEKKPAA